MMNALLLIDLQNDFAPGGALAVPEGNKVVTIANNLMTQFDVVVATQDWHPANHGSFASNHDNRKPGELIKLNDLDQILWPEHCVQNTRGAELLNELNTHAIQHISQKGTHPQFDSYSGFFDNGHVQHTDLHQWLQTKQVTALTIMGLATDYCVKFTVLDACKLGYHVTVITEGCRGIDLHPGDIKSALNEMKQAGAELK